MSAQMKSLGPPPIPKRKSEPPPLKVVERVIYESTRESSLGSFGFLVGMVCGYAFAYMILLEPVELLGHRMFWSAISEGRNMNMDTVIHSSTFFKIASSSAVGAIIGSVLARSKRT